jgi:hypothetical protein
MALPARSPNLNSYAERWVRSIKEECLSRLILFGENSLRRVVSNYLDLLVDLAGVGCLVQDLPR